MDGSFGSRLESFSSFYVNVKLCDKADQAATVRSVRALLESKKDTDKLEGMRIMLTNEELSEEMYEALLMTVIRYVAPSRNHQVMKMVQLYWERITSSEGGMRNEREEMLLISQLVRNELQSPNEYVRGSSLRQLSKICTKPILLAVSECVVSNLAHKTAYVRKNACLCIYHLVQKFGSEHFKAALDKLTSLIFDEEEHSVRRFALLALYAMNPVFVFSEILMHCHLELTHSSEPFDFTVIQLLRESSIRIQFEAGSESLMSSERLQMMQLVMANEAATFDRLTTLCDSRSEKTAMEAAMTLLWYTEYGREACGVAAGVFAHLLHKTRDVEVLMVLVEHLKQIAVKEPDMCAEHAVDTARILSVSSEPLRTRVFDTLALIVNEDVVRDVLSTLSRFLADASAKVALAGCGAGPDGGTGSAGVDECTNSAVHKFRRQLIEAVTAIVNKFPASLKAGVLKDLIDLVADKDPVVSTSVALFVRERVLMIASLQSASSTQSQAEIANARDADRAASITEVLAGLTERLSAIQNGKSLRSSVWLLGNFAQTATQRKEIVEALFSALCPFPLTSSAHGEDDGSFGVENPLPVRSKALTRPVVRTVVLPDGTYGTETVFEAVADTFMADGTQKAKAETISPFRNVTLQGQNVELNIGAIASCLFTLAERGLTTAEELTDTDASLDKSLTFRTVLMLASFGHFLEGVQKAKVFDLHRREEGGGGELAGGMGGKRDDSTQDGSLAKADHDRNDTPLMKRLRFYIRRILKSSRKSKFDGSQSLTRRKMSSVAIARTAAAGSKVVAKQRLVQRMERMEFDEVMSLCGSLNEKGSSGISGFSGVSGKNDMFTQGGKAVSGGGGGDLTDILHFPLLTGRRNAPNWSIAAVGNEPLPNVVDFGQTSLGAKADLGQSTNAAAIASGPLHTPTHTPHQTSPGARSANVRSSCGGDSVFAGAARTAKALALSGLDDPVYVEATTRVTQVDLILEFFLVNQTDKMLQDVAISIGAHGDIKILERAKPINLPAGESGKATAVVKLSSTDAGVIFGYCSFAKQNSVDKEYFDLNEIQVELLDCIERNWVGPAKYRKMWNDFEWENKIAILIATKEREDSAADVAAFLAMLLRRTKMTIVGFLPQPGNRGENNDTLARYAQMHGSSGSAMGNREEAADAAATEAYIAAVFRTNALKEALNSTIVTLNLASKSIFGEDALLNLSLQRENGCIRGAARIRSRTQGIALTLGDRVAVTQRRFAAARPPRESLSRGDSVTSTNACVPPYSSTHAARAGSLTGETIPKEALAKMDSRVQCM